MNNCTQNESGARRPDSAPRSHNAHGRRHARLRLLHPRTPLTEAAARPRHPRRTSSATPGHPSTSRNHFLSNPGTPSVLLKHPGGEPQLTSNHTDKVERGEEIGGGGGGRDPSSPAVGFTSSSKRGEKRGWEMETNEPGSLETRVYSKERKRKRKKKVSGAASMLG